MKKYLIMGVLVFALGLVVGAAITYAAVPNSFKIKENKMFFEVVEPDSITGIATFQLPSIVGRTGHVYVLKTRTGIVAHNGTEVIAAPGETVDEQELFNDCGNGQPNRVVVVGDESNNGWWVVSCD